MRKNLEEEMARKNGGMDIISQENWWRDYFVISRQIANVGEALKDFEVRVLIKLYESSRLEGEPIKNVRLDDIAEAVGRSKNKISGTLDDLRIKGLLKITTKQRKEGYGTYNEYEFLYKFKDWWEKIGKIMRDEFRKDKLKKYGNVEKANKALREKRLNFDATQAIASGQPF